MQDVAILGPGAVGGFVAAALAQSGSDVTVVARPETAAAIERDGIHVESVLLGDFEARPRAVTHLTDPPSLLVVATKATTLADALDRIQTEPSLVIPLLNGLDHMAVLRERFGDRVAAASIRIEAARRSPTRVVHTSRFLLIETTADVTFPGIPTRVRASEPQVLWSKLVRLNALALTTSATDLPVGAIRSDPEWRNRLEQCAREAAAVATAEGAEIDPAAVIEELDEAHAELRTSMQRDIAAGNEPELDAIAGSVLRAAARHGIECPTVAELAERVAERAGTPVPSR